MKYVLKSASTVEEAIEEGIKELGIERYEAEIEIIEEASSGFLGLIGKKDAVVKVSVKDTSSISSFVKDILYDDQEEDKEEKPDKNQDYKKTEPVKKEEKPVKKEKRKETRPAQEEERPKEKKVIVEEKPLESEKDQSYQVEDDRDFMTDQELLQLAEEFLSRILDEMDIDYFINLDIDGDNLDIEVGSSDPKDLGIVIGSRGSTLDAIEYLLNLVINNHRKEYLRVNVDANNYRGKRISNLERLARKGADRVYKTGKPYSFEAMNAADRRIIHMTLQPYSYLETRSEGREPHRKVVIYKKDLD